MPNANIHFDKDVCDVTVKFELPDRNKFIFEAWPLQVEPLSITVLSYRRHIENIFNFAHTKSIKFDTSNAIHYFANLKVNCHTFKIQQIPSFGS
jgi:hypothetical protein